MFVNLHFTNFYERHKAVITFYINIVKLSIEQRMFIVKNYQLNLSTTAIQREWKMLSDRGLPSRANILR